MMKGAGLGAGRTCSDGCSAPRSCSETSGSRSSRGVTRATHSSFSPAAAPVRHARSLVPMCSLASYSDRVGCAASRRRRLASSSRATEGAVRAAVRGRAVEARGAAAAHGSSTGWTITWGVVDGRGGGGKRVRRGKGWVVRVVGLSRASLKTQYCVDSRTAGDFLFRVHRCTWDTLARRA